MSSIIDISRSLSERLPVWPGDTPYRRDQRVETINGARCYTSSITFSAHSGTHLDAPAHLKLAEEDLGTTIEAIDLHRLIGPARVLDLRGHKIIESPSIHSLPDCPPRLLLHTDNSHRPYRMEDFVALTADAAASLVSRACLLVGIDGPSVDAWDSPDLPAHRQLLQAGVIILEGLDLSRADAGDYELTCLPLFIPGSEAAPARAILRPLVR